ncbi:MAG: serine/threonine-protein kinase [Planctomycetota bacterium]
MDHHERPETSESLGNEPETITHAEGEPRAEVGLTPGDAVGAFYLLEVIGYGGFGVVWLAEQHEPIRRRVAIKVIKPGMDSDAVLSRFEAERHALGVMDHPNIARVLDGGSTDRGLPYFVMEYVPGEPITDYCHRKKLGLRSVLGVFAQVCQAVQHAHTKGVIHRDIKPTNILVREVDQQPVAKVIDFGVAKALNEAAGMKPFHTAQGHIIGTPEYMAPEQAEGDTRDIDTRADVYSLGVTLYELLTGHRPFDLREVNWSQLNRYLAEAEPARPSTKLLESMARRDNPNAKSDVRSTARALKNDLDWVVMKCLEKDRSRRYQSAAALGDDIERFLKGEPVLAGPPSVSYRVGKYVRRHRGAIATVTAFAMVVGIAAAISIAVVARGNEAVEQEARFRAFVLEVIHEARPRNKGPEISVIEAVGAALSKLEEFDLDPASSGDLMAELARVFYESGRDADALGVAQQADRLYSQANFTGPPALFNRMTIAASLRRAGRPEDADKAYAALLPLAEAEFGTSHGFPLTVRSSWAVCRTDLGEYEQALEAFKRLVELHAAADSYESRWTISARISAIDAASVIEGYATPDLDRRRENLDLARRVLEDASALDTKGPLPLNAASAVVRTLADLAEAGDEAAALEAERVATERIEQADTQLSETSTPSITLRANRARARLAAGRTDEAIADFREGIRLQRQKLGEGQPANRREVVLRARLVETLEHADPDAAAAERAILVELDPLNVVREPDPARVLIERVFDG